MALLPIKIPAGFYRNATQYQAKNRWYTGNLVRFSEGRLRPIGGWQRLAPTQIIKKGAILELKFTNNGSGYSSGGTISATGGGGSGFAATFTVSGGSINNFTITNYGEGYSTPPTVVFSGGGGSNAAATVTIHGTGIDPIRGLHSWRLSTGARYMAVGSVQSLRIWDGSQSSGVNAPIYDITPPVTSIPTGSIPFHSQSDFQVSGLGYGALEYGGDLGVTDFSGNAGLITGGDVYGTPRYPAEDPDVQDLEAFRDNFAGCWSMDNFGDDLLACHSGEGTIWHLSISTGNSGGPIAFTNANQTATPPIQLANAPISNVAVLVTPERHIMVLGAGGNQRRIQWGHQEGLTGTATWTPSLTNTAGDLDLQTKGRIVGGFKTRYGVLVFTTSDVWKTNYLGPPYVYGVERITEGGGPVGMKCIAGSADFVAWMSRGRFWSFTGGYVKELTCDVADYVFSDINLDVEGLIAAGHNPEFGEIIWFYPKEGDENCTRYVTYSYREQHWTTGELERTALESSDALGYPVWAGADGYLYRHEMDPDTQSTPIPRSAAVTPPASVSALSGIESRVVAKGVEKTVHPNVDSEEHLCFAESGAIEIGSGNKMMNVTQILTDSDAGSNGLRLSATTAESPDGSGVEKGPYTLENDGYTDTRFTGRQAFLKVESPFDQEWRFGEIRFDASVSGSR